MVELGTVGGTPKSSTIPPREIGSAATLKDISTCASKRPIIGVHDARGGEASPSSVAMVSLLDVAALRGMEPGGEEVQAERPGEEGAGPLTSDAGAGAVQARGERPEGTLAGCDGHD